MVVVCAGAASPVSSAGARRLGSGSSGATVMAARQAPAIEPQVCSSCKPPFTYDGGPVLMTTSAGLTVTPIFWQPTGGRYAFPAGFQSIIDGYIANVAAASGSNSNVFSIDDEYYDKTGGTKASISYRMRAGTPIVDTGAFPSNGCTPASGYRRASQMISCGPSLRGSRRHSLPSDLAHFYPVFFPPGVETTDRDGTTSAGDFCGYHRAFGSGANQTVYADMPYNTSSGCNSAQAPNGNVAADGLVDSFSHELNEAITDPVKPQFAWFDTQGNEEGDMCGSDYGSPLGSTSASDPGRTEYNQVINGGKYYTQAEFSNVAFQKLGFGKGCAVSEAQVQSASARATGATSSTSSGSAGASGASQSKTGATTVITVVNDATPTTLPADGKSTAEVSLGVSDQAGNNVPDDPVHFSVGVRSGTGQCGTLSIARNIQ